MDGADEEYLVSLIVLLQPVTEPKNAALFIRKATKGAQLGEFAVQRCVETAPRAQVQVQAALFPDH